MYPPGGAVSEKWKCGAQPHAADPQDCDWPHCGCDPDAQRVMQGLMEQGWGETFVLDAHVAELHEALRLILPLAKGYAAAHQVGSNSELIDLASRVLRKHDPF